WLALLWVCGVRRDVATPCSRGGSGPDQARDGLVGLLELLVGLGAAVLDGAGHAVAEVLLEQAERDGLQRPGHRGDLREDVDAVLVLLDHPLQTAGLPLDAAQPLEVRLLVVGVSVLSHGSYDTLLWYPCKAAGARSRDAIQARRASRADPRPSRCFTLIGNSTAPGTKSEVRHSGARPDEGRRPWAINIACVVDAGSSSRWWVTRTVARSGCARCSWSSVPRNCSRAATSSPVEGSSSSNSAGFGRSARAMSARPRSPCDMVGQVAALSPSSPSTSMRRSARASVSASGSHRPIRSVVPVAPVRTTSRTVSGERSGWRGFTCPMDSRSFRISTRPSRCPSTSTVPRVGCASAPHRLSSVLLPAPIEPMRAQRSPARTVTAMSDRS